MTSLTGGCVCGVVRFAVSEPLVSAGWCHCTRCRRRTGAHASPQARVAPGSFRLTAGADVVTEYTPAGGGFVKAFCSVCGSHLYSREPDGWTQVSARLGAFDDDPGLRPAYHQRVESSVDWFGVPDDGLPRHQGRRPSD